LPDPNLEELQMAAVAADYYAMPLFAYVDHLRRVREQYGDRAARLDVEHAIALREAKARKAIEEAQKRP